MQRGWLGLYTMSPYTPQCHRYFTLMLSLAPPLDVRIHELPGSVMGRDLKFMHVPLPHMHTSCVFGTVHLEVVEMMIVGRFVDFNE